tara:strand:+ start:653 stop:2569 length:1917 start_codon:yes stop_codon:yes gene_type:complete
MIFVSVAFSQSQKPVISCSQSKSVQRLLEFQSTITEDQEKIDISFYRIDLDIDFNQHEISGSVIIKGGIGLSQPDSIEIDFSSDMSVDSVKLYGESISYDHDNDLLSVLAPQETLPEGYQFIMEIFYHGTPTTCGLGSFVFDSHAGTEHVWTLSEPYGARCWWPCKDDPSDKADSVDIIVRVPSNQIVASNGNLIHEINIANDRKEYYWQERYPISTYLVSLAIYPYTVWHDEYISMNGDTLPLDYYVFPDRYENSYSNYLLTKEMLSLFASQFGEYPFMGEKYGHADFGWGGAMEHQTLSSMGGYSQTLIAHELGHQWWGDLITCASFHHIWLNEGFARYCQALWEEYFNGDEAYFSYMNSHAYYGYGTIYVEDATTTSAIFNGNLSYNKASWVLHMLRHVVGDDTFFEILHAYASNDSLSYAAATTEEFQQVCEYITGMDLQDFFQQWIYGEKYPQYELSWWLTETEELTIQIDQIQTTGYFHMPIDLHVTGFLIDTTIVVDNYGPTQTYQISGIGTMVHQIQLDPNGWILKEVNYTTVGVDEILPGDISLLPAYPNPFNSGTTINFFIPQVLGEIDATLQVMDVNGRHISTLLSKQVSSGMKSFYWDASVDASGIYFIHLLAGNSIFNRKIILLK